MLTVKYENPNGTQEIFEVTSLEFSGRSGSCPTALGKTPTSGRCEFSRPNASADTMLFVYSGRVFVMNEAGKTVAKYDLGGWPNADVSLTASTSDLGNNRVFTASTLNARV